MGRTKHFEGIYARPSSILISFQWDKHPAGRVRETVSVTPTAANLKAWQRIRDDLADKARLDLLTLQEFAEAFPKSKWLKKIGFDRDRPQGKTFGEVCTLFIDTNPNGLEKTTLLTYRKVLDKHFRPRFEHIPIASVGYLDLLSELSDPDILPSTFNNRLQAARAIFAFAVKARLIKENPAAEIPNRTPPEPSPDPLTLAEVNRVLAHIGERFGAAWANYFEFGFFAGLRLSELIALRWEDVDWQTGSVLIQRARAMYIDKGTKTKKNRVVRLFNRDLAALRRQKELTRLNPAGWVFMNPRTEKRFMDGQDASEDVWQPTLKKLGIRLREARQTRHTCATLMLHAGVNIAYAAKRMGHSVMEFTRVYSKWIDDMDGGQQETRMNDFVTTMTQKIEGKKTSA